MIESREMWPYASRWSANGFVWYKANICGPRLKQAVSKTTCPCRLHLSGHNADGNVLMAGGRTHASCWGLRLAPLAMDSWSQPAVQAAPRGPSRLHAAQPQPQPQPRPQPQRLDSSGSALKELITSVISTDDSSYMLIQRCTLHFVSGQCSHCEASSPSLEGNRPWIYR